MTDSIDQIVNATPTVSQCCVCNQYPTEQGEWSNQTPPYKAYQVSHSYCSAKCLSEGSNVTIEYAQRIWKRMEDKNDTKRTN